MRNVILRWARIVGSALLITAVPIAIADYVLTHHALSVSRDEARSVAERYVERVDTVISEGLGLLRELRSEGRDDCSWANRGAFGEAAFNSKYIQQIGLVDPSGSLLCAEPMGSLTQPIRMPTADPSDPSVMIGVLSDGKGDRQAMVTLRIGETLRLVARFHRNSIALDAGPSHMHGASEVNVFLVDGSEWYVKQDTWVAATDPDAIIESMMSRRFPVKVVSSASPVAAAQTVAPLKTIVIVVATFFGLGLFAFMMWATLRSDHGDTFSRAVRNREFIPYYQPVVDLFTGEVKGCEVLVRWQQPDGSMVPPGQFLPYAEATGLIREITRQLMEKTVEDCADFYSQNPDLKLSINLTAMHFNDLEIVEEIRSTYMNSGIAFEQLCFEVTEQHPLKDLNLSRAIISRIQGLGCAVALDDVGTGHGGLAYLQKLGVDIIKIDKMFIDDIRTDHSSQTIVDTLVELGTQLGLGIIAEGVESQDQADHLKSVGVSTAQGYLFSPPLPIAAFKDVLASAGPGRSLFNVESSDGDDLLMPAGNDKAAA